MRRSFEGAIGSTLAGIADLFRKSEPFGTLSPSDRIDGKTCLVTGASSGLGFAVAVELARRGGRVIVASRSADRELVTKISRCARMGRVESVADVEAYRLDLLSFESVRGFVEALISDGTTIDIAVFNAGMVTAGSKMSRDGYDAMLQVNYLAKYLLIRKLTERSCFTHNKSDPARMVFVSSEAHRGGSDPRLTDLFETEPYTMSGAMKQYSYSKLLLTTFTEELIRRLPQTTEHPPTVLTLCPGAINSRIARDAPRLAKPLLRIVFAILFRSPKRAAEPVVFLACSPDAASQSGLYLHLMTRKEKDPRATDETIGRELWQQSEAAVNSYLG